MTNKRWSVIRKATGRVVRDFASRERARSFKRKTTGNVMIFDNVRNVGVR